MSEQDRHATDSERSSDDEVLSGDATADEAAAHDAEPTDLLPDDLQPGLVDPEDYIFPNNNRRRVPGFLYLAIAAGLVILYLVRGSGVLVNNGLLMAAAILAVFGVYSIVAGWNLDVDERDALKVSINEVGFPVGHASAQMGWRGLLSRPTWRILLYSAEEPPLKRALVLVDGVEGHVVEALVEDNPEDWSDVVDGERLPKGTQRPSEDAS